MAKTYLRNPPAYSRFGQIKERHLWAFVFLNIRKEPLIILIVISGSFDAAIPFTT
jgi:hypothetical protein